MLKTDLHTHTAEEKHDLFVPHTAKDLIRRASKLKYDVLALTNHDYVHYSRELAQFAQKKDILLIKGSEVTIEGKHVLCYGIDNKDIPKLKTFDDLDKVQYAIAPHPYFHQASCMGDKLVQYAQHFVGVEYCHFHTWGLNFNNKALKVAKQLKLPMVGNSDAHFPMQFHTTYSYIDGDKTFDGVFEAIRAHHVSVKTSPQTPWKLAHILFSLKYGDWKVKTGRIKQ